MSDKKIKNYDVLEFYNSKDFKKWIDDEIINKGYKIQKIKSGLDVIINVQSLINILDDERYLKIEWLKYNCNLYFGACKMFLCHQNKLNIELYYIYFVKSLKNEKN